MTFYKAYRETANWLCSFQAQNQTFTKHFSMIISCVTKTLCPHIYMKDCKLTRTELKFLSADYAIAY